MLTWCNSAMHVLLYTLSLLCNWCTVPAWPTSCFLCCIAVCLHTYFQCIHILSRSGRVASTRDVVHSYRILRVAVGVSLPRSHDWESVVVVVMKSHVGEDG